MLKSVDLEYGQVGESKIAQWLRAGGTNGTTWAILPVYELEVDAGKGPRIFDNEGNLVAPDMLAISLKGMFWVEAKHKRRFTWHRKTKSWRTGIDWHHYQDYSEVRRRYGLPLWLMFLHERKQPHPRDLGAGCPPECPTGLFGNEITKLDQILEVGRYAHYHENWGRHGMVYWEDGTLQKLAALDDMLIFPESP